MLFEKKNEMCCGCGACEKVCPVHAINMKKNEKGFIEPYIDATKCTKCGLCEKVCAFDKKNNSSKSLLRYAARYKNERKLMLSQSGGIFSVLAESIYDRSGVVYGVKFDSIENKAIYVRTSKKRELKSIRGSKYIQASTGNVFENVLNDLENNRMVLFGGTACHIDGLLSFLKYRKTNLDLLITCDVICHGVPSPKVFDDYLKNTSEEYKNKITCFDFRDKRRSIWDDHICSFKVNNKVMISRKYVKIFYSDLCLRESCYICPYATEKRITDITIGDCWGIQTEHPQFFKDQKGISIVLINTIKGNECFERVKQKLDYIYLKANECMQNNLLHPTSKPLLYDSFWKEYLEFNSKMVFEKFFSLSSLEDYEYKKEHNWKRKLSCRYIKQILFEKK